MALNKHQQVCHLYPSRPSDPPSILYFCKVLNLSYHLSYNPPEGVLNLLLLVKHHLEELKEGIVKN